MKPGIVFIYGIKDNHQVIAHAVSPSGELSYARQGLSDVYVCIDSDAYHKQRIVLDARPDSDLSFQRLPHIFFNEIANPDTHRITLAKVASLQAQLGDACVFLNRPEDVLKTSRDRCSQLLQGIAGLHAPLTLRIRPTSPQDILAAAEAAGLAWPLIIRPTGVHKGDGMFRLNAAKDVWGLHALPLDGREYYLFPFVDYAVDGVYRKLRLLVVDGEAYLRHVRHLDSWIVHFFTAGEFMQTRPELIAEEMDLLANFETGLKPLIQPTITAIHKALGLEYFGIDCAIDAQGEMLLFEANASMYSLSTKGTNVPYHEQPTETIKSAVIEMLLRYARHQTRQ